MKKSLLLNMFCILMTILLLNAVYLQVYFENKRVDKIIANYQESCKFCFKRSTTNPNLYSFTECPESYNTNFRFDVYQTKDKYTYNISAKDGNLLIIEGRIKFFLS